MTTSSSTSFSDNLPETLPLWRRLAIGVCLIVAIVGVIRLATPNANASAKPDTPHKLTRPIEAIRLGQRVVSQNPLRHETHAASAIDPKTWRAVRLHSFQYGVDYDLAFLRSLSWIREHGATVGSSIHLEMPEIGLDGPAEVIAIDACPPVDPDDGTGRMIVTGTMSHPATNVLDISISGETKPLGTTDTHPIWSEDRQAFIHAGELHVGERLQRADGTITQITRITPHTGPPVMTYNLEVDGEHVYRVGEQGLLVHNNCAAARLPQLKGRGPNEIAKILEDAGFQRTKPSTNPNQTWRHADGSEVRIHPYGNKANGNPYKTANNGHVHKQNPFKQQLNDR